MNLEKVEGAINQQLLINDLSALFTYVVGNKAVSISYEEYNRRFLSIIELDPDFLHLYSHAQFKIWLNKVIRTLYTTLGAQLTISLLATGEINMVSLWLSLGTGLILGRGISKILPESKIETTIKGIRVDIIEAGGPDLGGMSRIIKAGLKN